MANDVAIQDVEGSASPNHSLRSEFYGPRQIIAFRGCWFYGPQDVCRANQFVAPEGDSPVTGGFTGGPFNFLRIIAELGDTRRKRTTTDGRLGGWMDK